MATRPAKDTFDMATQLVVIDFEVIHGHQKPGVRIGTTSEYNPTTKDSTVVGVWSAFCDDSTSVATDTQAEIEASYATAYP